MKHTYKTGKRIFDLIVASIMSIVLLPVFIIISLMVVFDLATNPFFLQNRVGQHGKVFKIIKFRTIHPEKGTISSIGKFLRTFKLDELPQLFNIIKGDMSFVGPRPDIEGYYDQLQGEDRKILELKPGLTSEASIFFRKEEYLLQRHEDSLKFNDEVIFPKKVKMNLDYYYRQSLWLDVKIMLKTICYIFK